MDSLVVKKRFKHADVCLVDGNPGIAVVQATASYIPLEPFKEIFRYVGELTIEQKISKLIFDKRQLSVFHQPSMEWYFVEWKEQMFDAGLVIHRKILPQDDVFRQSVRLGREKIAAAYPTRKFQQMDIRYAETMEDAIRL